MSYVECPEYHDYHVQKEQHDLIVSSCVFPVKSVFDFAGVFRVQPDRISHDNGILTPPTGYATIVVMRNLFLVNKVLMVLSAVYLNFAVNGDTIFFYEVAMNLIVISMSLPRMKYAFAKPSRV